jgi:hypothetical protein
VEDIYTVSGVNPIAPSLRSSAKLPLYSAYERKRGLQSDPLLSLLYAVLSFIKEFIKGDTQRKLDISLNQNFLVI